MIRVVRRTRSYLDPFGLFVEKNDEQAVTGSTGRPGVEPDQLHPLVEPQLGQAWHDPARFICTPHCMHIGASLWRTFGAVAAGRTMPPGLVMSLLGAFDARPRSS